MLKSMTGFGRAEGETSLGKLFIESRSVNHRFCDVNIKIPKRFSPFENRIKEIVRSEVSRGRIDVLLRLDNSEDGKVQLNVDFQLAEQYFNALKQLRDKFQIKEEVTLKMLAEAKDLISAKEELVDIEPYWQEIVPILKRSFQDMDRMKRSEGEQLVKDIRQRLEKIANEVESIKREFPASLETYWTRLKERLQSILGGMDVDAARFQQEVAFLVERTDITEETVRAGSHLKQFIFLLNGEEPVGRKMDFLLQEIHREVNTISSKANDAGISHRVVEVKSELEKIREQVQNIE
jgi:uncharacterized protein (TIGR00255 family)